MDHVSALDENLGARKLIAEEILENLEDSVDHNGNCN